MPQVINTNLAAINAQRNLDSSSGGLAVSLQRLSSGLRINSAKDDAAGLAVATRFTSRIQGLQQASRNSNDAISLAQVTEGALQEVTKILQRSRELALQSANGTNSAADRKALQSEVNQLKQEMTRIADTTTFNGLKVLNGDLTNTEFQIGVDANQTVSVFLKDMRTTAVGTNLLKTDNKDGLEQSTHVNFIGGVLDGAGFSGISSGTTVSTTTFGTELGAGQTSSSDNGYSAVQFTLASFDSTGSATTTALTAHAANDTALEIAADINNDATSSASDVFVTASAYNEIVITAFSSSDGSDDVDLIINDGAATSNVQIVAGTASDFSDMAIAINNNTDMQAAGVYAIASTTDVRIISQSGHDFILDANSANTTAMTAYGLRGSGATVGVESTSSLTFGGRVDFQLDAGYTLRANVTGLTGGTADADITAVKAGETTSPIDSNLVGAQTLTITGSTGNTTVSIAAGAEASEIATLVNNVTATTGVAATAKTTLTLSNLTADGTITFNLYGDNGGSTSGDTETPAVISAAVTTTDLSGLVAAINDKAGTTGVTASISGSNAKIELTSSTGRDIRIDTFEHTAAIDYQTVSTSSPVASDGSGVSANNIVSIDVIGNDGQNSAGDATQGDTVRLYDGGFMTGQDSVLVAGQVTFNSEDTFSVSSNVDGSTSTGSIFNAAENVASNSTLSTVSTVDISTVAGAQDAVDILDRALDKVSALRADLGAAQSRFETAVRNIASNVENLSAARSRILDTDFAMETAALTKNQILAQAGVSILAQANSLPQNVLALLQ